jgi:ribosomal protein uL24
VRASPQAPRRQRRAVFQAPNHERRLRMTVPLSRELRRRFGRRHVPVRKGDTVRILSGSYAGREERVAKVNRRSYAVTIEGVTLKTAEEKLKPLTLRTSHLVITRLNLADPWRRRALHVREEEVTAEERGELPEGEAPVSPGAPAPSEAAAPTAGPAPPAADDATDDDEDGEAVEDAPATPPPARSRRRAPPAPEAP